MKYKYCVARLTVTACRSSYISRYLRPFVEGRHARFAGADSGCEPLQKTHRLKYRQKRGVTFLVGKPASNLLTGIVKKHAGAHPHSGDVMAWGYPNVAMSTSEEPPAAGPRAPRGQHGALNSHRELHPVLFAIGTGVTPGPLGEIRQTQIARYVAALLGIAPPEAAE